MGVRRVASRRSVRGEYRSAVYTGICRGCLGVKSIDPNIDVPSLVSAPGCSSLVTMGIQTTTSKRKCFAVQIPSRCAAIWGGTR